MGSLFESCVSNLKIKKEDPISPAKERWVDHLFQTPILSEIIPLFKFLIHSKRLREVKQRAERAYCMFTTAEVVASSIILLIKILQSHSLDI